MAYFMPAAEKPQTAEPAFFASPPPALPPPTGVIYNQILFNSNGTWKLPGATTTIPTPGTTPGTGPGGATGTTYGYNPGTGYTGYKFTYQINYDAILNWLVNTGPNPFPSQLRSGGIVYYDAIPTHIDNTSWPPTDVNQRFWKDYIDEMLGFQQTSFNSKAAYQTGYQSTTSYDGYGPDYVWGTNSINAAPYKVAAQGGNVTALTVNGNSVYVPSMDYRDNPKRPQTHMWFGPMTMLDFMGNFCIGSYNTNTSSFDSNRLWWPGTCHEAPLWQCKVGMAGALNDMQTNHPNDYGSLILFSVPKCGNWPSGTYNYTPVPMGQNYTKLLDSLWFAPESIAGQTFTRTLSTGNVTGTEMSPYDVAMKDVPRAVGGTCYAMGLMLAYNQFNSDPTERTYDGSPPSVPTGRAGGLGRKGSQKLIIFETDGMVSATVQKSSSDYATGDYYVSNGAYDSYYQVRQNDPVPAYTYYFTPNGSGVSEQSTEATDICTQICAQYNATNPGYGTPRKPVYIHTIAFGSLFDPNNSSTYKTNALQLLCNMQTVGNTQPSGMTTTIPSYKQITGTSSQRITLLQQAFSTILQDGLQLALIK